MDFYLLAYSDQFQLQKMAVEYLTVMQELCSQLEVKLTHMDYSSVVDDDDNDDDDDSSNEIIFDTDGTDLLRNVLKDKQISYLTAWSLEDEKNDAFPYDIHSGIFGSNPVSAGKLYIQFPIKRVENLGAAALFSFVNKLIASLNRLGRLDYALVTTMKPHMPQAFFMDVIDNLIDEEQNANIVMWNRRRSERKSRLRGIYWGNLLGRDHFLRLADVNFFKRSLEKVVGGDHMATINGDDLFFMLSSSDLSSGAQFDEVRELLIENNLLMQPDEEDRKQARWFLSY